MEAWTARNMLVVGYISLTQLPWQRKLELELDLLTWKQIYLPLILDSILLATYFIFKSFCLLLNHSAWV